MNQKDKASVWPESPSAAYGGLNNHVENELENVIKIVISEMEYGDAYGAPVGSESGGAFSGDIYAKGDSRTPKLLFKGIVTRNGLRGSKKHRKSKKRH